MSTINRDFDGNIRLRISGKIDESRQPLNITRGTLLGEKKDANQIFLALAVLMISHFEEPVAIVRRPCEETTTRVTVVILERSLMEPLFCQPP